MITKETIERIKSVSIETVASELGLQVTRHKCRCPFHDDKHPSMAFKPDKNICRCFVCDVTYGPINLVMAHERLPFADACRWIAARHGIWIDEQRSESRTNVKRPMAHSPRSTVSTSTLSKPTTNKAMMNHETTSLRVEATSAPETIASLDMTMVEKKKSTESMFCQSLVKNNILTQEEMEHAAAMYNLGIGTPDAVIFWQIDSKQRLRDGKIMFYGNDCHRLHNMKPTWVSYMLKVNNRLKNDFSTEKCLFGLHLIDSKPVAIVESEKTAVICSQMFPDFTWMATGGLSGLTTNMLKPLTEWSEDVKVIIFPDTDEKGETYVKWCEQAAQASHESGCRFYVSDVLERHATPDQRRRKIDIADYLIESKTQEGKGVE